MARRSSISVSGTPPELCATRGMLDQRWIELTRLMIVVPELDERQVRVDAEYQADGVWAGLGGAACERVTRDRGLSSQVAPLCRLPANLLAWLGWQEVWESLNGAAPFRFRNIGLTVHEGMSNDALKPQLLRLEWPGIRNWSGQAFHFKVQVQVIRIGRSTFFEVFRCRRKRGYSVQRLWKLPRNLTERRGPMRLIRSSEPFR